MTVTTEQNICVTYPSISQPLQLASESASTISFEDYISNVSKFFSNRNSAIKNRFENNSSEIE